MMKLACAVLVLVAGVQTHATPLKVTMAADLPETIDGLSAAALNSGYQLVKVQPIDRALVKRGYPDPGVRILFIGKASGMKQAMNTDPRMLSLLPLRLTLIVTKQGVVVSSDDLEMWKEMFPEPESARMIETWQHDLQLILGDLSAP